MITSAALLLVVLCSGYCFVTIFLPTRYRSARETGHRLYFRVALYAMPIAFVTSILMLFIQSPTSTISPSGDVTREPFLWLEGYLDYISGPAGAVIAILTLPVAVISGYLMNPVYHRAQLLLARYPIFGVIRGVLANWLYPEKAKNLLLEKTFKSRDFEKLVYYALSNEKPLLVTLDTGKVYVGLMVWPQDPTESREHLRIMPLMSGYRDRNTQQTYFTINYRKMIDEVKSGDEGLPTNSSLRPEDFEIVLPSDRIVSAHVFDPDVYQELSRQGSKQSAVNAQPTAAQAPSASTEPRS